MKQISITFLAILFSATLFSQIPNNGFETWNDAGGYVVPEGWGTMNPATASTGYFTVMQGTPGQPGDYYIKVVSRNINGMGLVPGIAVSGVLNTTTMQPVSGFPYTGRPEFLEGSWQFMAYGEDQGYISILLTRWTGSQRDTIAYTYYPLPGMIMSWRSFALTLDYKSGQTPDTALIVASASNANGLPTAEPSYIYLDNLSFKGNVAATGDIKIQDMSIYPNPATDKVFIDLNRINGEKVIRIISSTGVVVKEVKTSDLSVSVDVSDLKAGIYILKVNETVAQRKLIIR